MRRTTHLAAIGAALASLAISAPADPPAIQPVPYWQVTLEDDFWAPRLETNRAITVWHNLAECERTGRLSNFAKAAGRMEGKHQGLLFDDSDVYKAIEGACHVLHAHPDARLEARLDEIIDDIAAAQGDDGYVNTYYTLVAPDKRWQELSRSHELYCAGHLIEAAIAHHQATGKRTLLDVAIKFADLIDREFGPGKRPEVPGHQELELALIKLADHTGEERWFELATWFLEARGRGERKRYGTYAQDHAPVAEQREAVGHAVRALYMYAAMADVVARTGNRPYLDTLEALWKDVVDTKIYITGGVGGIPGHEGFGDPYQLPNKSAYNETCAAIANALWNHRMFLATGEARFIDVLESSVYNSFLSGVSFSGDRFFYPNPLEADAATPFNHGQAERCAWFNCACCPPNVVRFFPQIPGMIYAFDDESIYVNLFAASRASISAPFGDVEIRQRTAYPSDGRIRIEVNPQTPSEFSLRIRLPSWLSAHPLPGTLYTLQGAPSSVTWTLNGDAIQPPALSSAYADIHRRWNRGDVLEVEFTMPPRRVLPHDKLEIDDGRVALMRGPLIYCVEGVDHEGRVLDLFLPDNAPLSETHTDALGGVTIIKADAKRLQRLEEGPVFHAFAPLRAIPYYAWCSRGRGEMQVWIPRSAEIVKPPPMPTIASAAVPTASHTWGSDSPMALNDQVEPKRSSDGDIIRHTWWPRRGSTEWVQYTFAKPRTVSGCEVYWFDDTGKGLCRLPASWRVLYLDGDQWKPASTPPEDYPVKADAFNRVEFTPVTTTALRIEAQLQETFSGGILEWKVDGPF